MTDTNLRHDLDALRKELDQLPEGAPGRDRLLALLGRVEAHVEGTSGTVPHEPLVDGLSSAVTEFEVEHPRAVALLQRVISALSSMGI